MSKILSKTAAAYLILKAAKKPMHVDKIVQLAIEKKLISTKGKTPESTMSVDMLLENRRRKARGATLRFEKVGPAIWGLSEWK